MKLTKVNLTGGEATVAQYSNGSIAVGIVAKIPKAKKALLVDEVKRIPIKLNIGGTNMNTTLILKLVCKPDQFSNRTQESRKLMRSLGLV